ncbi:hypothetical protein [Streptomyces sp. NPDC059909]|uniref:hypothetical protein n=1 Tax=Streptomyces sp. NPDC059909 TaxID=3346998 RepID=UPI003662E388
MLIAAFVWRLEGDDAISWVALTFLIALTAIPFLGMGVVGAPGVARILQSYPWRAYPCAYVPNSRDHLITITLAPDQELVIHPVPYRCDLSSEQNPHPDIIWFAGDPACGGVASPAGGHYPQRVIRPSHSGPELPPADERAERAERAGLAKGGRYLRRRL